MVSQKSRLSFGSLRPWVRSNPLLSLLILAVVLSLGFFAYRTYEIRAEKRQFEQARASIDALYEDIVANVGEPAKVEKKQSCSYASRKFERGPRTCGVRVNFVYGVDNSSAASSLAEETDKTLRSRTDIFSLTYTNRGSTLPFKPIEDPISYQRVGSDIKEAKTKMSCYLTITYAYSTNIYHVIATPQKENLSIQMGCGGDAKAEHYPVNN